MLSVPEKDSAGSFSRMPKKLFELMGRPKQTTSLTLQQTNNRFGHTWEILCSFGHCTLKSRETDAKDLEVQGSCGKKDIIITARLYKGTGSGQVYQGRTD